MQIRITAANTSMLVFIILPSGCKAYAWQWISDGCRCLTLEGGIWRYISTAVSDIFTKKFCKVLSFRAVQRENQCRHNIVKIKFKVGPRPRITIHTSAEEWLNRCRRSVKAAALLSIGSCSRRYPVQNKSVIDVSNPGATLWYSQYHVYLSLSGTLKGVVSVVKGFDAAAQLDRFSVS